MKKFVVLSGSGISQESGIPTFRDMGGIWENYNFTEVASPKAWAESPELVLKFYNFRRKGVINAKPNNAHLVLKRLEDFYDVHIITQNVDDLHERAGSKNILHLHGEIRKARSTKNHNYIIDIVGDELNIGDLCPQGFQLRPHTVWFGEPVDNIMKAVNIIKSADILLVIGTSLNVYPAADLIYYAKTNIPKYLIDPSDDFSNIKEFIHIKSSAVKGIDELFMKLEK